MAPATAFTPAGQAAAKAVEPQPVEQSPQQAAQEQAAPAAPVDGSAADRAAAGVLEAAAINLADCLSRLGRKEAEAVRRAAGKPGSFVQFLPDFYGKHEGLVASACTPALTGLAVSIAALRGIDPAPAKATASTFAGLLARKLCDRSRSELRTLDGLDLDGLLTSWSETLHTLAAAEAKAFADLINPTTLPVRFRDATP